MYSILMCVHVCKCVYTRTCLSYGTIAHVVAWSDQRLNSGCVPQSIISLIITFFEAVLSLNLKLEVLAEYLASKPPTCAYL